MKFRIIYTVFTNENGAIRSRINQTDPMSKTEAKKAIKAIFDEETKNDNLINLQVLLKKYEEI